MEMYNACAGANEKDFHYINVNPKRDFKDVVVADIRMVQEGDCCPHCNGHMKMTRGIEAGQVFTLAPSILRHFMLPSWMKMAVRSL
mgnify:CR=1 FL=1